jgi:hypothetical protein
MLTELQSNILGVDPRYYSVFNPDEQLPLPAYEDTLSNLLIGSPNPLGSIIPGSYLKELNELQITTINNRFTGGLLPLCINKGMTFKTILNQIDCNAFAKEQDLDWLDLKAEYWQTRWLAYRSPQNIVAAHLRTKKILTQIGKLFAPSWLLAPAFENYTQQNLFAYLGTYIVMFLGEPIEEQLDEWSSAIELNWLNTLESRSKVYEQFNHKLTTATVSECWSLIEELESLRPKDKEKESNYEYCVAKISSTDYNRLKNMLMSRITGKENDRSESVESIPSVDIQRNRTISSSRN